MKRLGILRHAKSSWDDPALDDFDRSLNQRGREAATRMGEVFRSLGLSFDLALVSPARRAAETFDRLCKRWGQEITAREEPRIYGASVDGLLDIVGQSGSEIGRLLLVGHNPGLHELAVELTRAYLSPEAAVLAAKFPTGSLAEIELPIRNWAEVQGATGRLVRFLRPRDLD